MDQPTRPLAPAQPGVAGTERDDDNLEIRYSLTSLGELVVARSDRGSRGPRFRGFGPCGAVA